MQPAREMFSPQPFSFVYSKRVIPGKRRALQPSLPPTLSLAQDWMASLLPVKSRPACWKFCTDLLSRSQRLIIPEWGPVVEFQSQETLDSKYPRIATHMTRIYTLVNQKG